MAIYRIICSKLIRILKMKQSVLKNVLIFVLMIGSLTQFKTTW